MSPEFKQELMEALEALESAFSEFSTALRHADTHAFRQWEAGGFLVSDNIVSMYPCAREAAEKLAVDKDYDETLSFEDDYGPQETAAGHQRHQESGEGRSSN